MLSSLFTLESLRVIPGVVVCMAVIHICMLLLGINERLTEIVAICGGFFIITCFSIKMRFCITHRIMIFYAYATFACIWWQDMGPGFGEYTKLVWTVMFVIGMAILIYGAYDWQRRICGKACTSE